MGFTSYVGEIWGAAGEENSRWYLRGFLPSDSVKCCKLQHFVRCLCSIFKCALLSHVLGIPPQETTLQIETGRQRDPKESWRDETHRSFNTHTHRGFYREKSLHRGAPHTHKVLHREVFTLRSFCTQTSRSFYTQKLLHREVFTQRALTHSHVYTQKLLHREAFTQRVFTHGSFYTQRNLYTDVLSHREAFTHRRKLLHIEVFT